jgi:hypothetical protein
MVQSMRNAENSRGPEGGAGGEHREHQPESNSSTYNGKHQDSDLEAAITSDSDPVMAPTPTSPTAAALYFTKENKNIINVLPLTLLNPSARVLSGRVT